MARVAPEIDLKIRQAVEELRTTVAAREQMSRGTASLLFFRFNLYPSVQLVHSYTRWGSVTDISKDVDAFWAELRATGRLRLDGAGVPDELAEEAGKLLGRMYEIARDKATSSLDALRDECRQEVRQAQDEAQQAAQARLVAEDSARVLQEKLEQAVTQRQEAEQAAALTQAALDQARIEIGQWKEQFERERAERVRAEEQFSRDLASQEAQRKASEERLNGEIKFAKMQIEEARAHGRDMQERNKALEADHHLVSTQLRQQINGLRDELGQARMDLGEQVGESRALRSERDRLLDELREVRAKLEQGTNTRLAELLEAKRNDIRTKLIDAPGAFEVKESLSLFLDADLQFECDEAGQDWLWLGGIEIDGNQQIQATPRFRTLDELDEFCQQHVERYTDLEAIGQLPSPWFWEKRP